MVDGRANTFRIISFTLAGADVLQTIPGTCSLYKKQWVNRTISPVCVFYAIARYSTIISLVANGIGFYSTDYTLQTCEPFFMLPNITAMLAGMAVQILVFIRTYAISGRSRYVFWGLGLLMLLGFPIQIFGIVYHRVAAVSNGNCKGKVTAPGEPDWNIVYYSAHMGFDIIACVTGIYFLVRSSWNQGIFNTSKFVRRVLRNGVLYTVVVFVANLWVVLEFQDVLKTGVGATLPLAVVLIAVQHLILSTQRPHSDAPSSTDEYSRSAGLSGPRRNTGALPLRSPRNGLFTRNEDVELQSGVFVVTETYIQPRLDERKTVEFGEPTSTDTSKESAKGKVNFTGM